MHHNKQLKGIVRATTLALMMTAYPATSYALAPNEYQEDGWVLDGSDSAAWGGGTDFTNTQIKNGARLEIGVGCNGSGTFCANLDYDSDGWFFATSKDAIVGGKGTDDKLATLFVAGESTGTTVQSGGQEIVAKGTYVAFPSLPEEQIPRELYPAKATGTIVEDGGLQTVYAGGTSVNTIIKDGGKQYVTYAGGDGIKVADEAGTAIGTKVMAGGFQYVYLEGAKSIGTILEGGKQHVYGKASATGTVIKDGGIQYIRSNTADGAGTAIDTIIESGGTQYVYLDGSKSINAELNDGGKQNVYGNGSAVGTVINNGGVQSLYDSTYGAGYAEDTIINAGGRQQIQLNASAKNTTVNGGQMLVYSEASATDTTVNSGTVSFGSYATHTGKLDVHSGLVNVNTSNDATVYIENISLKGANSNLYIGLSGYDDGSQAYLNLQNLENNGVVQFSTAKNNDSTSINTFTPITLNVDKLTGNNGVFAMHADIGAGTGDLLKVNQLDAANKSKLYIANNGASTAQVTDVLTVVETTSGGTADQFSLANKVEQGGYEFGLKQEGNNWVMCADASCAKGAGNESGSNLSSSSQYSANFLNISYLVNYVETQTLMQRMGDLRNHENPADIDIWARAFTGKVDSFDGGKLSGFDMDYSGTQIGADKRFNVPDGKIYLGGMLGYTDASPNYSGKADSNKGTGSNKVTNYSLGIYGSYVNNNHFYVDGLVRYNSIKNDFNVADTAGSRVSGEAKTNGYSASIEAGKRFYMYDLPKGNVYLEPQVQLSYAHQDSNTVNNSNGLKVDIDSYESTLGRISAVVGYETQNTATPINVYFKTGYVREFSGDDVGYYLNGSREEHSFKGNFWDNEIGISARIQKQHTLHADVGYAAGDRFNKTQVNVGYRFEF